MDLLNHAFYAITRPFDCLCAMCVRAKPCTTCKKPSTVLIKARTRLGYKPYCKKCAIPAAKAWRQRLAPKKARAR